MALFTRQLAVMLRSGVGILEALDTLSESSEDPVLGKVVKAVARRVGEGHRLSAAMRQYPRTFSEMYVSMIQVGESSGGLEAALDRLAGWMERDQRTATRIGSALVYPAFVLGLTFFLTLAVFYSVLPSFARVFEEMGVALPLTTRLMIAATNAIRSPATWLILAGLGVAGFGGLRALLATESGACKVYAALLSIPVVGGLLRCASTARFCASLEALLSVGIGLTSALQRAGAACGNPLVKADMKRAVTKIQHGETFSSHLDESPELYPRVLTQVVRVGEETSTIAAVLGRLGVFYDQEVEYRVDALGATLEPVLLLSVATVVGFVVISIFIPMYSYLGTLA